MKLFLVHEGEEMRCNGCGWRASRLYRFADTKEQALKEFEKEGGLCGACIADLLREWTEQEEGEIILKEKEDD